MKLRYHLLTNRFLLVKTIEKWYNDLVDNEK